MVLSLRGDRAARGLAAVAAAAVFLGCWELLHHWFYAHNVISDVPTYQGYGIAMRNGIVPYRDIPVEYPPGALPVFVAPTYVGGYVEAFGWLMAACGVGCIAIAAAAGASLGALAFIAISPLLIGSLALSRFDFWPTLFVAGALAALSRDRHSLGWGALAAAIAAKLFAVVLVPVALVWTLRRGDARTLRRAVAAFAAVLAAAFVPFLVLAPGGVWRSLHGELSRPLQIETLAASVLTTFSHPTVIATHGSLNLAHEGPLADATTAVEALALLALWIGFARGPMVPERFVRYAAAALCAFVVFGKVLSPQFLIWLVPVVPLVRGRRGAIASALLAAALFMTLVYFPSRYGDYIFGFHLAWLVLLRDLALVALLAVLSRPELERPRSS